MAIFINKEGQKKILRGGEMTPGWLNLDQPEAER